MILGYCYNVGMNSCVMLSRGGDPAPRGRSTCCYILHTCRICNEMRVSDNGGLWVIIGDYYSVGMDSYVKSSRGGDREPRVKNIYCYTLHICRICNERGVSDNRGLWVIIGDCYNEGTDSCGMSSRDGDPAPQGRSTCCYILHSDMICNERGVSDNRG